MCLSGKCSLHKCYGALTGVNLKFFFMMKLNFFQSFFIPGTFHDFASSGVFFFSKFRLSTKKKRKFRLIILFLVSRANLWKSSKSKALCIFYFRLEIPGLVERTDDQGNEWSEFESHRALELDASTWLHCQLFTTDHLPMVGDNKRSLKRKFVVQKNKLLSTLAKALNLRRWSHWWPMELTRN